MKFYNSRTFIAILLLGLIPFCYYSDLFFYSMVNFGLVVILKELFQTTGVIHIFNYFFPLFTCQFLISKNLYLFIVIYTQISDIFQYLGGKLGTYITHKILRILKSELSNFKLEFKKVNFGIKNTKELYLIFHHYLTGSLFSVSPNKSICGYLSGLAAMIFIFSFSTQLLSYQMNLLWFLLGCAGDLYASSLKRERNLKDFSKFLGEHGGFLDRFDSTAGVLYFYCLTISLILCSRF